MRVTLTFVALVLLAATIISVVSLEFASARGGDTMARVVVLALAPIAAAAITLAGRIVVKVEAARQRANRG